MSSSPTFVHGGAENCDNCYRDRKGCKPKGRNGDFDRCSEKGWACSTNPNRPRRKEGPSKASGSTSRDSSASTTSRTSNVFTPTQSRIPKPSSSGQNAPRGKQSQTSTGLVLKKSGPGLEDESEDFEPSENDSEGPGEVDEDSSYDQEIPKGGSISGLVCTL